MRPDRPFISHALAMIALASTLTACPGVTPPPQYPIHESSQIVAVLHARDARLHSLRAQGSAEQFGRQGRLHGNVTMFVQLPDRMRVDAFAFGHLVSSMVSDGHDYRILQGQQFMVGPARACVTAQLLGIPLEARDVATVLTGGAPLISENLSIPRWENGYYVVEASGPNDTHERIELELPQEQRTLAAERQSPRLHRVELRDHDGVRAEIRYENYRVINGGSFPDRVRVIMPREHTDTELRFDQVQPNFTIPPDPNDLGARPPDPFQLTRPNGAEEVPLVCD